MGCHESVSDANKQLAALHINEPNIGKEDSASIQTSSTPENPSNSLNPSVGIRFPQLDNPEIKPRKKKVKKSMSNGIDEVGCTPDSPDCKNMECKMCATKQIKRVEPFGKDYTRSIPVNLFNN